MGGRGAHPVVAGLDGDGHSAEPPHQKWPLAVPGKGEKGGQESLGEHSPGRGRPGWRWPGGA